MELGYPTRIKFDYGAVAEVFGPPTPEEMAILVQTALKLTKTEGERKNFLKLLRREIENSEEPENSRE